VLQPKQKPPMLVQPPGGILDFSSTGNGYGLTIPIPGPSSASASRSLVIADDTPLDLTMDAVDLSKKNRMVLFNQPSNSLLRPRALYPGTEGSNLLVTSPYITKRDAVTHPQLSIP